jgi:hypothetical protein
VPNFFCPDCGSNLSLLTDEAVAAHLGDDVVPRKPWSREALDDFAALLLLPPHPELSRDQLIDRIVDRLNAVEAADV